MAENSSGSTTLQNVIRNCKARMSVSAHTNVKDDQYVEWANEIVNKVNEKCGEMNLNHHVEGFSTTEDKVNSVLLQNRLLLNGLTYQVCLYLYDQSDESLLHKTQTYQTSFQCSLDKLLESLSSDSNSSSSSTSQLFCPPPLPPGEFSTRSCKSEPLSSDPAPPPPGTFQPIKNPPRNSKNSTVSSSASSSEGSQFQLKLSNSIPRVEGISNVNWATANKFLRSGSGSSGVFFIGFPPEKNSGNDNDQVLVVKGCKTIAQEVFVTELALFLGIKVPKMRVVEYVNPEWDEMKSQLLSFSQHDHASHIVIQKNLDRAFIIVEEYVPGKSLDQYLVPGGSSSNNQSIREDKSNKQQSEKKAISERMLRQMGEILVLDMIVNNIDRFPAIWDNDYGNLQNLIIHQSSEESKQSKQAEGEGEEDEEVGGQVIGIDQDMNAISSKTNAGENIYKRYEEKVMNYGEGIRKQVDKERTETKKVRQAIIDLLRVDIQPQGSITIQKGMKQFMQEKLTNITKQQLQQLKEQVGKTVTVDWADVWAGMMRAIDIEFIWNMIQALFAK